MFTILNQKKKIRYFAGGSVVLRNMRDNDNKYYVMDIIWRRCGSTCATVV